MKTWSVYVSGVGFIGTIQESSEEFARCAALVKFGEEGERNSLNEKVIYEDEDFSVNMC